MARHRVLDYPQALPDFSGRQTVWLGLDQETKGREARLLRKRAEHADCLALVHVSTHPDRPKDRAYYVPVDCEPCGTVR